MRNPNALALLAALLSVADNGYSSAAPDPAIPAGDAPPTTKHLLVEVEPPKQENTRQYRRRIARLAAKEGA